MNIFWQNLYFSSKDKSQSSQRLEVTGVSMDWVHNQRVYNMEKRIYCHKGFNTDNEHTNLKYAHLSS